ncbi:MAG: RecQ family ATP-dependent DNA helicase [Acholeplasmatales bacterium]|nr:RecQ family ATP-dependent DNA helicase [Acholeplasmatales bacterium]
MKEYNLNELLKYYFGYDMLKPMQEEIVNNVLDGFDTIGLLPTGFGKSITFQLPALMLDGITIVITPLIALMQDQVMNLKKKAIKAEFINSLLTIEEQDIIYNKLKNNKIKILYVSAERLLSNKFLNEIKDLKIDFLVCDEAHTLLWSEDFRKALGKIPEFLKKLKKRPKMLALTATATPLTTKKICELLDLNNPKIVVGDCDRENIFYNITKTNNKDRDLYFYIKDKENIHGLIYCITIKNVVHVYNYLKDKNIKILMYHGNLTSDEKKNVLELYKKHLVDVIVCTNAFGMGVDIPDIRYVIEYDIPQSIEDFLQQSGRASRDGKYAEALVLFNINDIKMNEYFIDNIENDEKSDKEIRLIKKDRYDKLDKVCKLFLGSKCVHKSISEYFNIKYKGTCKMCSNCVKKKYNI